MAFLTRERETCEEYLPGLDAALAALPLMELERPGNEGLRLFREAGGPALLIPRDYAGLGASSLDAIRIQRAIAARSPSLAVAMTMHHFSVTALIEMAARAEGLEGILLEAIARQRLLVASGFAEGRSGRGILAPTMQGKRAGKGFIVNGSKKPCSLTWSMDLLTASIAVPEETGGACQLAVILIPAAAAGIERRKFWGTAVLGGAESDEVILRDVFVSERQVFLATSVDGLDPVQVDALLWFELLISASYVGMASALVERAIRAGRGEAADRALLGVEVEGAMAALEGVARAMMAGPRGQEALAQVLFVRYAVQGAIERVSARAVDILGGMAYIGSPDVSYLYAAARALAFHPPSRSSMSQTLAGYLAGDALTIQ